MKNVVNLMGYLGQDPQFKKLENDVAVARITIATSKQFKNKLGEKVTQTEWHTCIAWRHTAEYIERYFKKGTLVDVTGELTTRSYDKDGEKRYSTDVVINRIIKLTKSEIDVLPNEVPADVEAKMKTPATTATSEAPAAKADDDLPF